MPCSSISFSVKNRYCWRRNNFNDIKQSSRVPRKQLIPCFECFYHKCFSANQQNMQHLYGLLSTGLTHVNSQVYKTKLSRVRTRVFNPKLVTDKRTLQTRSSSARHSKQGCDLHRKSHFQVFHELSTAIHRWPYLTRFHASEFLFYTEQRHNAGCQTP